MKLIKSRFIVALLVFVLLAAGQGFGSTGARKKKSTAQSKSIAARPKAATVMNKQKLAVPLNAEVAQASTFLEDGISRLQESLDCNC